MNVFAINVGLCSIMSPISVCFLTKGASDSNSAQVNVVPLPEKCKNVLSQVQYIIFHACTLI